MNALRAWLALMWRGHCATAERITPAIIGSAAVCMAWGNASGGIHE